METLGIYKEVIQKHKLGLGLVNCKDLVVRNYISMDKVFVILMPPYPYGCEVIGRVFLHSPHLFLS